MILSKKSRGSFSSANAIQGLMLHGTELALVWVARRNGAENEFRLFW
jgi:hypothetical protein